MKKYFLTHKNIFGHTKISYHKFKNNSGVEVRSLVVGGRCKVHRGVVAGWCRPLLSVVTIQIPELLIACIGS